MRASISSSFWLTYVSALDRTRSASPPNRPRASMRSRRVSACLMGDIGDVEASAFLSDSLGRKA